MKNCISKEENDIKNQSKSMSIKKQKKNTSKVVFYLFNNTQENIPASATKAARKTDHFVRLEKA